MPAEPCRTMPSRAALRFPTPDGGLVEATKTGFVTTPGDAGPPPWGCATTALTEPVSLTLLSGALAIRCDSRFGPVFFAKGRTPVRPSCAVVIVFAGLADATVVDDPILAASALWSNARGILGEGLRNKTVFELLGGLTFWATEPIVSDGLGGVTVDVAVAPLLGAAPRRNIKPAPTPSNIAINPTIHTARVRFDGASGAECIG